VVRNLPGFARFLPVAGTMHAQTLNVSSLARDAGVARQTVQDYLQILDDTLLARTLAAFEGKLRVRERRSPKLYLFDPGVVRALRRELGPLQALERGPLLEGLVFMLLTFYAERDELFDSVGYWAPAEAKTTEVDFVLARRNRTLAIEVKATRTIRPADLRGLRAIGELAGLTRRLLVFLGSERLTTPDGIEAVPLAAFSDELARGALWP
jgi:predicted AAA+ superfamily ATPase